MIKFIQREYKAILLGVLIYGLFITVTKILENHFMKVCDPIDSPYFEILHILLNILGSITIALPGYVAGRLSVRSGTKNGILIMLICTTTSLLIFHNNIFNSSKIHFIIAIYLSNLMIPVTIGGLGGAVGKHHKEMREKI